MTAPDNLYQLVEKFERDQGRFHQPDYNEAQLRQEFVNPFFAALGWDVGDSKQVLHEAGLRSGGSVKHPDYSFLAGSRRAFYVETKKPSINIGNTIEPAEQLRSYGWSGNTALGILTNFAEFAVYDCRIEPKQGDSPAESRVMYLTYSQYLDRWGWLREALSPEAVRQGAHRELLETTAKGVLRVDEAFLRDMEAWRVDLAEHLHKQAHFIDRRLNQRELNHLVQRTIDRIVFLRIEEKRRILLDNIYGVDLDQNAVEVSKLSLLLKMLENEHDTVDMDEPLLPDLSDNIKWGNSLIGSDFFSGEDLTALDDEELLRVKPFDWASSAGFGEIMATGGFDAVIGNPPYVRQETLGREFKVYAKAKYETYAGTADLYTYFIERGVKLLNENGLFGIIVANKWLRTRYGKPLRSWLKKQVIREIVDFGDLPVFQQATTYPCILTIGKDETGETLTAAKIDTLDFSNLAEHVTALRYAVDKTLLDDGGWSLARQEVQMLLQKLFDSGLSLEEYVNGKFHYGIKTGLNEAFVIDSETKDHLIAEHASSAEIIKPFLAGRDIKRYIDSVVNHFVIFARRGIDIEKFPAIKAYLAQNRKRLEPKPAGWQGVWQGRKPGSYTWYEIQDTVAYFEAFEKPKIIYPNICKRPEFTMDSASRYTNQKCFIIGVADKYLLGILNSQLMMFYFQTTIPKLRGDFYEPGFAFLKSFPIRQIDFNNPADVTLHDMLIALVERMLDLHRQADLTTVQRDVVKQRIEAVDREIDGLVYALYGLSEAEREIVEAG